VRTEKHRADANRPEVKERFRAAMKAAHNRPEVKERHSIASLESQNRPEVKAKKSATAKEVMNRPEVKERCRIAINKPEVKAKKSVATKKSWDVPEIREKRLASINNPEIKEKRRVSVIETMSKPEYKKRHSAIITEAMNRPEVKERHRAATKEAMNRPEVKERHRAATKEAHNRPEVKANRSIMLKEVMNRPEVRARRVIISKDVMNRPEVQEKRRETMIGGFWYGSVVDVERKKYCECWNSDLWERIDEAQGYKSIISDKTREDNGGRALSRHHVYWQEKACCVWDEDVKGYYAMINIGTNGKPEMYKYYINGSPNKFVLLTREEHGMVAGNKKLGTSKLTWIKVLEDLIETKLGGKCYYTKEEYAELSLNGRFTGEGRKVGHGKLTDEQIDIVKKATGFEPNINLF